jgi:hypothetical protein
VRLRSVVSCYTIFHIQRKHQADLFARIREWLRPGGLMLASLGRTDGPSYTEPGSFGFRCAR